VTKHHYLVRRRFLTGSTAIIPRMPRTRSAVVIAAATESGLPVSVNARRDFTSGDFGRLGP
jgi:hypothetical protein